METQASVKDGLCYVSISLDIFYNANNSLFISRYKVVTSLFSLVRSPRVTTISWIGQTYLMVCRE
jgi:hypothetical protein